MTEEWKDIKGFEGRYQVSNLGRVRSLPKPTRKGVRILKSKREGGNQYCRVTLVDSDGKNHGKQVHRLVAEYFLENPHGFKVVNHKNGEKSDNRVQNLEWTTSRDNTIHAFEIGLIGKSSIERYPICQYTESGTLVAEYPSALEAEHVTGIPYRKIQNSCRSEGKRMTRGYYWRYVDIDKKKVRMYDAGTGTHLATFKNFHIAANVIGGEAPVIGKMCLKKEGAFHTYKGYKFVFE